ncbi:hypothetical protein ACWEO1_16780 [Kitasatospora cineracea]
MSTAVPALSAAQERLLQQLHQHGALERSRIDPRPGWVHHSAFEVVLAHGRWCAPAPLPDDVEPLPERECFANAALTERRHRELVYTEGYALVEGLPMVFAHAWCTTADGRVVDPTWADLPGTAYLGIPLTHFVPRPVPPYYHGLLEHPDSFVPLLRDGLMGHQVAPLGRPLQTRALPDPRQGSR